MAVTAEVESSPAATGKLRYNSPLVQVSLIGLVCFCCPGMFNALTGLGGGGQLDHSTADNANTALYSCFAVFGVLGGAAHNLLGPRVTLLAGALTYPLYAASFLYYNHHPSRQAFPVTAGALLGVGAGLLWAAQGAIMTSYPPPSRRGSYISLFWCLFNLGGVLGGLLPFSLNYHRAADAASVNDATYIAFMAFMLLGAGLALLLLPASRIVRDDGSRATRMSYSSVSTEGWEILKLFANWRMLLVLPAAWASNFFYTYQFNNVNGRLFTCRTKGLNNVFYWGAQMLAAAAIGYFLDFGFGSSSRRRRGLCGVAAVAVLGTAIWPAASPTTSRTPTAIGGRGSSISRMGGGTRGPSCSTSATDCWTPCSRASSTGSSAPSPTTPKSSADMLDSIRECKVLEQLWHGKLIPTRQA
ncbi:Os04g0105400 [Oryza sativa Japonica Group]|uniref:Os04g0105400 protein n=1 Tax=Oryza sativa subsp. japonica TaxID=39947 RepID=A0A0P0W5Y3_ORYSJ|nr:Os04g0105400 [Oryza sativa Japonica Group]